MSRRICPHRWDGGVEPESVAPMKTTRTLKTMKSSPTLLPRRCVFGLGLLLAACAHGPSSPPAAGRDDAAQRALIDQAEAVAAEAGLAFSTPPGFQVIAPPVRRDAPCDVALRAQDGQMELRYWLWGMGEQEVPVPVPQILPSLTLAAAMNLTQQPEPMKRVSQAISVPSDVLLSLGALTGTVVAFEVADWYRDDYGCAIISGVHAPGSGVIFAVGLFKDCGEAALAGNLDRYGASMSALRFAASAP